jgi:hypothetical protein
MNLNKLFLIILLSFNIQTAFSEQWVEIGADAEAIYFVDLNSIHKAEDSHTIIKRAIYNQYRTEYLGSSKVTFISTIGVVELDCNLNINRVIQIDMLDGDENVVWSSGYMEKRIWQDVRDNTHAKKTYDLVCQNSN